VDIVPKVEKAGGDAIVRFMTANPDGFATLDEAAAAVAAYLPHRPRPPSNDGLMKNLRPRENGRLYWHWDPRLITSDMKQQRPAEMALRLENAAKNLKVPTLLVRGAKSDLVSMEGVKHFLTLIPDADFVDVAGAAHMVAGDMNDVFSQAIIDFMKKRLQK
jgi:pimeloyl-ACP methyl ester carboxylesterase